MATTASGAPLGEIPVKLRCAICANLCVGAVRLPCCEQSICGECHGNLPEICPICDYTPLKAENCKPNKPLQQTCQVFVRKADIKYAQAVKAGLIVPTPPLAKVATPVPEVPTQEDVKSEVIEEAHIGQEHQASPVVDSKEAEKLNAAHVQPEQDSAKVDTSQEVKVQQNIDDAEQSKPETNGDIQTDSPKDGQEPFMQQLPQQATLGDQSNSFQQSQFNQWGGPGGQFPMDMTAGSWNGFNGNMMDPISMMNMMPGMHGGFPQSNFGGAMGAGMGGGFDAAGYGAWNQGWGMQNGVGGSYNSTGVMNDGFYNGGYNQHQNMGNHHHHGHHQQQFQNHQGFQGNNGQFNQGGGNHNYPRGGGYGQQNQSMAQQQPLFGPPPNSEEDNVLKVLVAGDTDEQNDAQDKERPKDETDESAKPSSIAGGDDDPKPVVEDDALSTVNGERTSQSTGPVFSDNNQSADSFAEDGSQYGMGSNQQQFPQHSQQGYPTRGGFRGNFGNRGTFRGGFNNNQYGDHQGFAEQQQPQFVPPQVAPGVEGAPTGPKAMRDRGGFRGRARGGFPPTGPGRGGFAGDSHSRSQPDIGKDGYEPDPDRIIRRSPSVERPPGYRRSPSIDRINGDMQSRRESMASRDDLKSRHTSPGRGHSTSDSPARSRSPSKRSSRKHRSSRRDRSRSKKRSTTEKDSHRDRDERSRSRSRSRDRDGERERSGRHSSHRSSRSHRHKSPSRKSSRLDSVTEKDTTKDRVMINGEDQEPSKSRDKDRNDDKDRHRTGERSKDKHRSSRKHSREDRQRSHRSKRSKHDDEDEVATEFKDKDRSSRRRDRYKYYDDEETPEKHLMRVEEEREKDRKFS